MTVFCYIINVFRAFKSKKCYFYRLFYIAKICGNKFITALFMPVKISVKVLVN